MRDEAIPATDGTRDGDAREHLERQRRLLADRASHLRRIIGAVDEMLEEMSMNDGKNTTMDARAHGVDPETASWV